MLFTRLFQLGLGLLTAMFVVGQIKADTGTATGWWSWFAYGDEGLYEDEDA